MSADSDRYLRSKSLRSRKDILEYFREIIPTLNPNWTNTSDSDVGMVIVNILAMLFDSNNFKIDMTNLEHYLPTVNERANAQAILNLIGYQMDTYKTSECNIVIRRNIDQATGTINNEYQIDIPAFSTFSNSNGTITYYNLEPLVIPVGVDEISTTVYEGVYTVEQYDSTDISSTGTFYLSNILIPENAVRVTYNNDPLKYTKDVFLSEESGTFELISDKFSNNYIQFDATWKD